MYADKLLFLALGFAAESVTAIDMYLHYGANCGGDYNVYRNTNPTVCHGENHQTFKSIAWRGIPKDWDIECVGYGHQMCKSWRANGRTGRGHSKSKCFSGSSYSGGQYYFPGMRRSAGPITYEQCNGPTKDKECNPSRGPSAVHLADGTEFELAGIAEAEMEELAAALAATGGNSTASDIPAKFDKYKVANY